MLPPNTILRERYRIIHQLGHGGMGAVYQAMDENLSCVVAVKETFATNDEQRRAFRREAELLANLTHPALPRVMDHFTHGEGQFLVMQFVPGHDLAELLELREQPFPVAKVLDWADQLLDALEDLHSSAPPIIHRDIKPANLKVTPKGKVLLLDFGLAKGFAGQMSTADADSRGKSIYGYTAHYAPLEQMRGVGTDQRSDLYSLAATLWTLLTGKIPPDALTRVGEKEEGNPDPLRPAHEINPQVPLSVSNQLQRAMSLNRNQRQDTATELRNELKNAHKESESATQLLPPLRTREPTSLPPDSPPLGSTMNAPEPTSQSSPANPQYVPTIRVDSPPAVPTWDRAGVSSTAASFAGEESTQRKPGFSFQLRWGRFALIVASVLVIGTSIVVWRATVEQPNMSATAPNQTSNRASTVEMSNPTTARTRTNQVEIEFVLIPAGSFMMGSINGEAHEKPVHQVTISQAFYIGKYEVTQAQWQSVMGNNPSHFKGDDSSVKPVSWLSRPETIRKLNHGSPLNGHSVRLAAGQGKGGAIVIEKPKPIPRPKPKPKPKPKPIPSAKATPGTEAPKKIITSNRPVEMISWLDAQQFIQKLNQLNDGYIYRLPTESEWEYAGRAGTTDDYAGDLDSMAWYSANSGSKPHPVGARQPNGFGLYDMYGNVSEWCEDLYHGNYVGAPSDGSAWLSGGEQKYPVLRGGSWNYDAASLRSAYRGFNSPDYRSSNIGFRLVAVVRTSN